ncbi:hypothetical protein CFC21_012705 [Triticum aestivum]|uniref:F-box protein At3g26010-like beta-propeller domain-containing protein n=2 Tax=Triticum aestivum TaxID=4565 RepID=A0A9R1DQJ9_WHEAT|nr:uncharacterized protein LOC123170832 [Triticum aestivum]KAF6996359.1 hypothetical protein CFC21_012704 [Triticum aestivum]KAF6996360.1 hypothetical protein CFC21_012705 [Triticum aestivum]
MLSFLRAAVSGRLRRTLSTAAARPPWAMMYRVSQGSNSTESVSSSLAPPPSVSFVSVPSHALDIDPFPPQPKCVSLFRGLVLAASGHGLLLLDTHMSRLQAHDLKLLYRRFARFVCNPVTGQLLRLPDFDGAEKTLTDGMGLLTQAYGASGPPKRYAAAQLTEVDGGQRFLLRRFSSETGDWDERVLPSPMPPRRRMHMVHEVLDYGGRLWWVDVSWGAICVDPFSDRPELCPVELPAHSMLPDQLDENEMRQLIKHRHMGVSAGRLLYAEVDPLHIRSFTLDDESRRWTLQHQVSVDLLPNGGNAKEMPLVAAVDPLDTNLLHLNVDRVNFSIDMSRKRMIESTAIPTDMSPPSESATTSYLPCVLPSFLRSSPIPGKKSVTKNKTLADVLVRLDRHHAK